MSNIPNTKRDVKEMLNKLELDNINNLFDIIPEKFKINQLLFLIC